MARAPQALDRGLRRDASDAAGCTVTGRLLAWYSLLMLLGRG
jgi:hypothetical protein